MQSLKDQKSSVEEEINRTAHEVARDLGLELGKTIKLEWHRYVIFGKVMSILAQVCQCWHRYINVCTGMSVLA
jgi:hypothetical protein